MKPYMRSVFAFLTVLNTAFFNGVAPASAISAQEEGLSSERIAIRSLTVAESMRTSGYCYAGVSKALSPLGVTLTGSAAYQAREQLLVDPRFLQVSMDDSLDLLRGDIIVFNKSATHPYGHICVYQGNGEESSDHVSRLSDPNVYGGVSVFRLRSSDALVASGAYRTDWAYSMPITAPDFRNIDTADRSKPIQANADRFGRGATQDSGSLRRAKELVKREFRGITNSVGGGSIGSRLVRFVLKNL